MRKHRHENEEPLSISGPSQSRHQTVCEGSGGGQKVENRWSIVEINVGLWILDCLVDNREILRTNESVFNVQLPLTWRFTILLFTGEQHLRSMTE